MISQSDREVVTTLVVNVLSEGVAIITLDYTILRLLLVESVL